jgi:3-oxoacyl-[acyl-carrier protein] reductase
MTSTYTEFHGKVALISGGGGIGQATAEKLAENGCHVYVADYSQAAVDRVVAAVTGLGGQAAGQAVDVRDAAAVEAMVTDCVARFGRLDYLVLTAGVYTHVTCRDMDPATWDQTIGINLTGVYLVTHFALPHLTAPGGAIVTFGSQAGIRGSAQHTHYGATKAALQGFTRCLMHEVARDGIRVNCVAPGVIDTPMGDSVPQERWDKWLAGIPLGRFGRPREAATLVAFLLSDDAGYITGQTIPLNGGSGVNT